MKITIVSVWYNEALLAPFFLNHYNYVDEIHIFLDMHTNDKTEEICRQFDNVEIEEIRFPKDRFGGKAKMRKINSFIVELKSDWVYVIDADEFIVPEYNEEPRIVLARQTANLLYTKFWQTWKHETETALDPLNPSIYQRRHGVLAYAKKKGLYKKPVIVKPETNIIYKSGTHSYCTDEKIIVSKEKFMGFHWGNADIDTAISRKMNQMKRKGMQDSDCDLVKKEMKENAEIHLIDARLF